MGTQILIEQINLDEATFDAANRTLRDVILIRAGESANKREYPPEVLKNAVSVFEGVKAYADHPSRTALKERSERSIRDITGWYSNVRFDGQALRADRVFSRTQAGQDAMGIAEDIVTGVAPRGGAGLSINAVGTGRKRDDGGVIVEAITHAHSVDDVTTPAAGGGYTESAGGDGLVTALLETLEFEEWREARPDFVERLKKEYQTVRLDEQTRASLAEADLRVKAAEDEAGQLATALAEAQAMIEQTEAARDAAVSELETARHELAVEKLLRRVKIPAAWEKSLREALVKADPDEWEAIISAEESKAKAAGHRLVVTGADPQTQDPVRESGRGLSGRDLAPRPDEDVAAWQARISKLK